MLTTAFATLPQAHAANLFGRAPAHVERRVRVVVGHGGALTQGVLRDGPRHTLEAIRARPARYLLMLAAIGAAGAGAKAAGVDPAPYALGLSGATFLWSSWKSLPALRAVKGRARLRRIGAELLWPLSLVFGTALGGKIVGDHTSASAGSASLRDIGVAGGQSVVIGIDVPTIAQTTLRASTSADAR